MKRKKVARYIHIIPEPAECPTCKAGHPATCICMACKQVGIKRYNAETNRYDHMEEGV
jgi:hypothetical protein